MTTDVRQAPAQPETSVNRTLEEQVQELLKRLIDEPYKVSVVTLASLLSVSPLTVRQWRDGDLTFFVESEHTSVLRDIKSAAIRLAEHPKYSRNVDGALRTWKSEATPYDAETGSTLGSLISGGHSDRVVDLLEDIANRRGFIGCAPKRAKTGLFSGLPKYTRGTNYARKSKVS